jgi:hypothetical protein
LIIMDQEQAVRDVTNWLTGFVEKPNPLLNGWAPCPYARAARMQNKIRIDIGVAPWLDIRQLSWHGMADLDVIVKIYDPQQWPLQRFRSEWQSAQTEFFTPQGLLCLEDHPADPEIVNGVVMNQGTWALLLLQHKTKLEEAAAQLAARGYYQGWPDDYLVSVFHGREDPRS